MGRNYGNGADAMRYVNSPKNYLLAVTWAISAAVAQIALASVVPGGTIGTPLLQRDTKLTDLTLQFQDLVEGYSLQLTNPDASRTFAYVTMHENRLYIFEGTTPKGYPDPALFQGSVGFVDDKGNGIRYVDFYANGIHGLRQHEPPSARVGGVLQGEGQQTFAQPQPLRPVTVAAIPGVVAAGAQWTLAWSGTDNADGITGMPDGSVLFAQEQPSRVTRIHPDGTLSIAPDPDARRRLQGTGEIGCD